jgi:hypothetical protein
MAHLDSLAQEFRTNQDWSGYTLKDLRAAIDSMVDSMLVLMEDEEIDYWTEEWYKPKIDYLFYMFASMDSDFDDEPSSESYFAKYIEDRKNETLSGNSKKNFLACYATPYFYKYINVEIAKLRAIVDDYSKLPFPAMIGMVDFYIGELLLPLPPKYRDEDNPMMGELTYRDFADENEEALDGSSLYDISKSIALSLRRNNESLLFKSIFRLMTEFDSSNYRTIHEVITTILDIDMEDFGEMFLNNLDKMIQNQGTLQI